MREVQPVHDIVLQQKRENAILIYLNPYKIYKELIISNTWIHYYTWIYSCFKFLADFVKKCESNELSFPKLDKRQ